MIWLPTLAVTLVLVYWLRWRWTHRRMLELAAKVPGPPAWPFIGNTMLVLNPVEQMNILAKLTRKYGDYLRIWLGPDLNIFVKDPADIRTLLTSTKVNQKGPNYDMMKNLIGPGILTGGSCWRNHRKIATPSYNKKCVQHYAAIFNQEGAVLAEILRRKEPELVIDVYKDVVWATTQSVCQQMNILAKLTRKYGDYLRIWLGPDLNIFVKDPADIRTLLTSTKVNQKGPNYDMMKNLIGPGILTGGSCWRNHRKIATPSYNKKCVQHYAAIFNQEGAVLAEILRRKEPELVIDVYKDVVWATTQSVCQQMNILAKLTRKYGDYLRIWLGPDLNIFVKDPADIRTLLTSTKVNQKGPNYDMMKNLIGPGILTGGSCWRNHRKIATPSYNKKCVQHYAAIFNQEGAVLAEILRRKEPELVIDVYKDVVWATTQSVCQTLMGLSKEESQNLNRLKEVVYTTQAMYGDIYSKITKWWLHIPFVFWLVGGKAREDKYIKLLDDLTSDIVDKRRRDLNSKGVNNEDTMGIVDRYIISGELNEQELKWETFSLFTTSQEAAAKIASGVLMVLAHLPDWQEKVYNEILQVCGPYDEAVSMEQLKELHYLDMVYKETLRYFSIAALIQRTVEEEITINNGKITLPAGTSLVIPIHDVHRDPRYWEEPHRVMPDRFLPENVAKRDPNAFIPFSLGPMDCLGRVYATALIKILTIRILRQIHLEGCGVIDNLPIEVAISVKAKNGYRIKVKPRKVINGRIHA